MIFVYGLTMQVNERTRWVKGSTSSRLRFFHAVVPVIVFLLLTTGCHPVMSTQSDSTSADRAESSMFPLRFYHHGFAVHCYNTIPCQVTYYDHDFTRLFGDKRSGPPPSPDYRGKWTMATRSWIPNFPPPAEVRWTSLGGVEHEAKVDIGAIFKDQRVLYRVPDAEFPDRHGATIRASFWKSTIARSASP